MTPEITMLIIRIFATLMFVGGALVCFLGFILIMKVSP
jgi:uncharacterized membrane protein